MNIFLEKYSPTKTVPVSEETIERYKDIVPESLVQLWKQHGFGKYNNGLIELVDPAQYQELLEMWLGKKVDNYVPIMISAFGDLYYYRKLTPEAEDVCVLYPQYKKIENVIWSLDGFFNETLTDDDFIGERLSEDYFNEALEQLGLLEQDETYIYKLAFALGGAEDVSNLDKGNTFVQHSILFQL